MLETLSIVGKDLRILKNIYWQRKAAIKIDLHLGHMSNGKAWLGCTRAMTPSRRSSSRIQLRVDDEEDGRETLEC